MIHNGTKLLMDPTIISVMIKSESVVEKLRYFRPVAPIRDNDVQIGTAEVLETPLGCPPQVGV